MSLTKKQIQQWVLVALGGAISFLAVIYFVVAPLAGAVKANRETTLALRAQLGKVREAMKTGAELQRNLQQTRADIQALTTNIPLPVLGNYLLGGEQEIYACCAGLNMRITGVTELDVLDVAGWNGLFKIYRVRVAGQAGINDLARYFHVIHQRNALVSVTALNITPQAGSPAVHNVNFVAAWLIWANPDKRPAFLQE